MIINLSKKQIYLHPSKRNNIANENCSLIAFFKFLFVTHLFMNVKNMLYFAITKYNFSLPLENN